ncbi:signal recognition particle protein [Candidatus Woesearchaeota archaeon]|nr:signal recognition particle protein [Candidatus Woesearchaeota archaeon]
MVLENLGSKLKESLSKITRLIFVDEKAIDDLCKEIQRSLLSADVNVKLVFELTQKIKKRALEKKKSSAINERENLINIVYEELVNLLGGEKKEFEIKSKKRPYKIMFVGLFGSGKTSSVVKVGNYLGKRGYKVCAVGLDVHRPAAMEQLEQSCSKAGIKCFIEKKEKNALKIYNKYSKDVEDFDIVLMDTAGRDALSKDLLDELKNLKEKSKADEVILVISADIGQTAFDQAKSFHDTVNVDNIIVTKMDGSAKAGGALSACGASGAKVIFIGVGEKINDLETFNPKGFVGRILGMGDLEALLKKVEESVEKEEKEEISEKFLKGEFTFVDLYKQLEMMRKLGPLSKVVEMIPGFGNLKIPKELLETQDVKFEKWKYIMNSLTKKELEDPEIISSGKRVERIAKGAGVSETEVRDMLKQYRQVKKVSKLMKGKKLENIMSKFGVGA